jgi:RNA-directed DNA polymerase
MEFRCSGDVARLLAEICTFQGHVPTGSPISMPAAFYAMKERFDALYLRMLKRNSRFTVYVDDITVSGPKLMRLDFCAIKKTLRSAGLRAHKTHFFGTNPAAVTGVIVDKSGIHLPNRRHQRIIEGIRSLASLPLGPGRATLAGTLRGQIHEAANVDQKCKARLDGYKRLVDTLLADSHKSVILANPS